VCDYAFASEIEARDAARAATRDIYLRTVAFLRGRPHATTREIARAIGAPTSSVASVVEYHRRSFRSELTGCDGRQMLVELRPCLR
jgi:hypothetical protein